MERPDTYCYPAVFAYEPGCEIAVEFPDLGAATSGATDAEALASARELLGCVLLGLEEDGEEIPEASALSEVAAKENERAVLVDAHMPAIRGAQPKNEPKAFASDARGVANHAERSMLVYKIVFNARGHSDDLLSPQDINGNSAVDLFEKFCERRKHDLLTAPQSTRHALVDECERTARGLLIKLKTGASGASGDVIDIESCETDFHYEENHATMIPSRCYLLNDCGDGYALLCIEHVTGSAGDTLLFGPFRDFLRAYDSNAVVRFESIKESEAVEGFNAVNKVTVKRYLEFGDSADALVQSADCVTSVLTHKRGKRFPMAILWELMRNRGRATTLLGIDEESFDASRDTISVEIEGTHGRRATFVLGDGINEKIREVLNHHGEEPLPDAAFVRRCEERCDLVIERLGRMLSE